ncbi:hypothetical protein FB382_000091 [Nocardioides ginsengisegetis]|uniref:Double zinc ribbon n=1 Tax=Nocardioides ginsengisegetis TaxID=661491 RepID=A0A7W3IW99_9ACTN|nr:hypothetical protein [Nocardioides ginsengisegetis]MBA8801800.1 hypothetical protein [Nocardioides ginsengisegetis]
MTSSLACSRCGNSVADLPFCTSCGTPRDVTPRPDPPVGESPCSGCGAPSSGTMFCTRCGTPSGAPSLAGDRPPPFVPGSASRGAGRTAVVVAVALLVVLAGAGGAAALLHHRSATSASASAPAGDTTSIAPAEPTSQASSDTASASEASAPPASTTPPPPRFRCWDGTSTARLEACGSPYAAATTTASLAGLNWVFLDRGPRLEAAGATCVDIPLGQRVLHRQCTFDMAGSKVCMNWSQFTSAAAAMSDYLHLGPPERRPSGGATLATWSPTYVGSHGCLGLGYKAASMVDGQRWGVTAYGSDPGVASAALARFGEFRPMAQWRGVRH